MAVVLAEGVSGSIEKFADEMNRNAQRLGMTQTSYVNPNGLPADEQITSARDLAILARALIREFPEYDFYWHIPAIRLGKRVIHNYNALIDRYPGADGMKTGFICASGYNLVATATRDGRRLIAVVLGARNSAMRAQTAAQLLENGFNSTSSLSWLLPSLGTVDNLAPINAAPPNLRDEMCGPHRKRPGKEETVEDEAAALANGEEPGAQHSFLLSSLKSSDARPPVVLGPLASSAPPIEVYVGPPRKPPGTAVAARPPKSDAAGSGKAGKPTVAAIGVLPLRAGAGSVPVPRPKPAATKPKPVVVGLKPAGAKPAARAKPAAGDKPAAQ
jgi:D-alanyl-D-alanine carboxypeptidase